MEETQTFGYNQAGTIGQSLEGNTFFGAEEGLENIGENGLGEDIGSGLDVGSIIEDVGSGLEDIGSIDLE